MEMRLAENIRKYRKEKKMTQEMLAEVMGVTLGAVSKWELGTSVPDITLIMELANYFEVSVDALLGYESRGNNVEQLMDTIRNLRNEKKYDEACRIAEQTISRYPNNFEVICKSALLYGVRGIDSGERTACRRAIELMEQALLLISQNKDPKVNQWTIRNQMAPLYLELGETEKALEIFKSNNAAGLNNCEIGLILARDMNRPKEAYPYLSEALVDGVTRLIQMTYASANAYDKDEDYVEAEDIFHWMVSILRGLKVDGKISYYDRAESHMIMGCAMFRAKQGDRNGAIKLTREALEVARRYDAAPYAGFQTLKFVKGKIDSVAIDSLGNTAEEGLRMMLEEDGNKDLEFLLDVL